jgi:hypothetical protein
MNDDGKKLFLSHSQEKLKTTVMNSKIKRIITSMYIR